MSVLSLDPSRVRSVVWTYAIGRAEKKTGHRWDEIKLRTKKGADGKERRDLPEDFVSAYEKVCEGAFMRLRACKCREDFAAFFTGTICSEPQHLPPGDFQAVASALTGDTWEDARSLTMLALSSISNLRPS